MATEFGPIKKLRAYDLKDKMARVLPVENYVVLKKN